MKVSAQLLSSSLSDCGRKLVCFALKVQVSGDLWSPAVVPLYKAIFIMSIFLRKIPLINTLTGSFPIKSVLQIPSRSYLMRIFYQNSYCFTTLLLLRKSSSSLMPSSSINPIDCYRCLTPTCEIIRPEAPSEPTGEATSIVVVQKSYIETLRLQLVHKNIKFISSVLLL